MLLHRLALRTSARQAIQLAPAVVSGLGRLLVLRLLLCRRLGKLILSRVSVPDQQVEPAVAVEVGDADGLKTSWFIANGFLPEG